MDSLTLAYLLIAAGAVILLAEMVVPTGGALLLVAVGLEAVGVLMVFRYGTAYQGAVTLGAVLLAVPAMAGFMFAVWPHTPVGRRLIRQAAAEEDATLAHMPVNLELEQLRGRYGRAISPLRPSGAVNFDGRRIDAMSDGGIMIEEGRWVRCTDVKPGRVIVRAAEQPPEAAAGFPPGSPTADPAGPRRPADFEEDLFN